MVVLFDTSALLLFLYESARPPVDPKTGKPLDLAKQRLEYLIRSLSRERTKVLIPTPVLTELLVKADKAKASYIALLQQSPFRVVPFDSRAAIELAEHFGTLGTKEKGAARSKVKFDRQIVSIGLVEGVDAIYSDDEHIYKYANQLGLTVVRSYELPIDPNDLQHNLALEVPERAGALSLPVAPPSPRV